MVLSYFLKGLAIGFSLSIPVGPIALLCIRRTLARGHASGLMSGMGAATADAVYGAVAGFGITFISNFLFSHSLLLRLAGGVVLCYLGVRIFRSVPAEESSSNDENGLISDYVSTFFLTLTNPLTMVAFAAIFAAAGVGEADGNYISTMILVMGVTCGSALWWLILSGGVSLLHGKVNPKGLQLINRVSGTVIAAFGLLVLLSLTAWAGP